MNKKTKLIIAILILLNLVLATFLFLGSPNKGMQPSPKEIIVEKLGFDEDQEEQYQKLIEEHQLEMMGLHKEIKKNKTLLYKGIAEDNKTYNDSIISIIGNNFEKIEQVHYNHFKGIKNICNQDQKQKFDALTKEINQLFSPRGKRPKH